MKSQMDHGDLSPFEVGSPIKPDSEDQEETRVMDFEDELKTMPPWMQPSDALRRVEEQFTAFFLQQIGPTPSTESKRATIFNKVKALIECAYEDPGKYLLFDPSSARVQVWFRPAQDLPT